MTPPSCAMKSQWCMMLGDVELRTSLSEEVFQVLPTDIEGKLLSELITCATSE